MAATIHVPTIDAEHVMLGMVDGTDPDISLDNRAYNELRRAAVLKVDPDELVRLKSGGDNITIPYLEEPADFGRVDHSSGTPLVPNEHSTKTDKGVVQWNKVAYQFKRSDMIRSGKDASAEYSRKIGGKIAKRLFQLLMKTAVTALDSADTPTSNVHVVNVYNATTPALATLARIKAAKATLGDAADRLTTMVMHSKVYQDVLDDLLTNYKSGAILGDRVSTTGALGQVLGIERVIVTDLMPTTGGAYNTLLLGPGALWTSFQQEPTVDTDKNILNPSTLDILTIEFATCCHLRFMKWAGGSDNPSDSDIETAVNWDEAYDDHRRLLAAKLVTN